MPLMKPIAAVGGLSALLSTLMTVVTFALVDRPGADQARQFAQERHQMDVLQRALQVESADGRRNALRLLFGLRLLPAEHKLDVEAFLKPTTDTLPFWRPVVSTSSGGASSPTRDTTASSNR